MGTRSVSWVGAGLFVATTCAFVACSSFGGDDPATPEPTPVPGGEDAGADTSVGGEAVAEVELTLPKVVLVHGQTASVEVKVTRKPPFTGRFTIVATGLPKDLGVASVDVAPGASTANVTIVVGKGVPQGALQNVKLEARNGTVTIGSAVVECSVRGAPGELDTTFGKDGFIDVGGDYPALTMQADGSLYVMKALPPNDVRKYTKDGALDGTFATGGVYAPDLPFQTLVWRDQHLYLAGALPSAGQFHVRKLDAKGALVTAYGGSGTYIRAFANTLVGAISIGANGAAIVGGKTGTNAAFLFVNAAGMTDFYNDGFGGVELAWQAVGAPGGFNSQVHTGTHVVAAGGKHLTKANATTHALDNSFGGNGYPTVDAFASLTSVAMDANGNFVAGGIDSTMHLVITRTTPTGTPDLTFNGGAPLHTSVIAAVGQGALTVSADKIIQVGTLEETGAKFHCVVARYKVDGAVDMTFGVSGRSVPAIEECYSGEVRIQPDGRILVSGSKILRLWQ